MWWPNAFRLRHGPAAQVDGADAVGDELDAERSAVAGKGAETAGRSGWHPGDAPTQALRWAVASVAKAGTVAVIGVYPPDLRSFPIGEAMNKNLTVNAGNCNHRRYLPELVDLVATGHLRLAPYLSRQEPMTDVIEAYHHFDRREPGWLKLKVIPG